MNAHIAFVKMANPHSWLMASLNLHGQAVFLYANRGKSLMTYYVHDGLPSWTLDSTNKAAFLLGGFALENAIKAFLVFENPQWISNGKLSRELRSHSLRELQRKSTLIPYRKKHRRVLVSFENALESWGRYPCGLSATSTEEERILNAESWDKYNLLISAYRKRLIELLAKGWKGPHGFEGRWTFSGDW